MRGSTRRTEFFMRVEFSERATDDLAGIALWIAGRSDAGTAHDYVERLRAFALRLANHPLGGTPRDELLPGLRSITFERRYIVLYEVDVEAGAVRVFSIVSGFRNLPDLFA
jgi:toxin ParE1/3/4